MTNQDRTTPDTRTSRQQAVDAVGQPVNVVERDLADRSADTRSVDEAITPSSTRTKEQEAEELNRKSAEIERKVADGN